MNAIYKVIFYYYISIKLYINNVYNFGNIYLRSISMDDMRHYMPYITKEANIIFVVISDLTTITFIET